MNRQELDLIPASDQDRQIIENLGRLYTYDISEYAHSQSDFYYCQEDGRFQDGCKFYYEEDRYLIYLIKVGEELGGFAIVEELHGDPEADYSISEFFVSRPFRRTEIGKLAAHFLFDRHAGRWDVCVWLENRPAFAFWDEAIKEYTAGQYATVFGPPTRSSAEYEGWRLCTTGLQAERSSEVYNMESADEL